METKTLQALRGSISKWENIVAGTAGDMGPSNCPLCQEFFRNHCVGCPVSAKVGASYCGNTPYSAWRMRARADAEVTLDPITWGREDKVENEEDVKLAQAELDFLRSLLPEEVA